MFMNINLSVSPGNKEWGREGRGGVGGLYRLHLIFVAFYTVLIHGINV
jgi:hypothetical protein